MTNNEYNILNSEFNKRILVFISKEYYISNDIRLTESG